MSYVPSHQSGVTCAQPQALTLIEHTASTSQTLTVGNRVNIGTIHNLFGGFSPTISTNQITLASGYYYYLETSIQVYQTGSFSANSYVSFIHYDETGSANIGLPATVFQAAYEDSVLFSRDACARALIDCTSASKDISIKPTASFGNFTRVNYSSGTRYAGMGRTVIFQLKDAP